MQSVLSASSVILEDSTLEPGHVIINNGVISEVSKGLYKGPINNHKHFEGFHLAPGFIDLHVHGGMNSDFMDGTPDDFHTVCKAHLKHGTTSLLATSTAATMPRILEFLKTCRACKTAGWNDAAQVLGAHFYGPYFLPDARGCHPAEPIADPTPAHFNAVLDYADTIITASVAPELPGAKDFVNACRARNIRCNAGHSHATFSQVEAAVGWGVRHVDHLYCAMSDRARLRLSQTYPMRGGLFEATLFFDELTTEVIADGRHLSDELLRLAFKVKGPDSLALVTDANRAMDMPDGEYIFGNKDEGCTILKQNEVGLMPDGKALASSVAGMDHCVRVMRLATKAPLPQIIRMASLTPAKIAGFEKTLGSIAPGKVANLLILDQDLQISRIFLKGIPAE